MCVGLLLDTLIARTLLIPALVSLFGRGAVDNATVPDGTEKRAPEVQSGPSHR
jgi:uncharacterized membrane protein YdfJ with MMPL/SSD domain